MLYLSPVSCKATHKSFFCCLDLKAFNQLSNSFPILSCDNLYLSEWESGLKPSNEIPNLSTLTFVFNSTKKTLLTNDVDVFVKQFNASALITAISEDTGVDVDLYSSYSAETATNNVSILIVSLNSYVYNRLYCLIDSLMANFKIF